MTSKKSPKNTFEDSLKRLESIVDELEQGSVPLEDAVALYEEGVRLSRLCAERLKAAELRIRKLALDSEGNEEEEE